jgi:hypothetical protein
MQQNLREQLAPEKVRSHLMAATTSAISKHHKSADLAKFRKLKQCRRYVDPTFTTELSQRTSIFRDSNEFSKILAQYQPAICSLELVPHEFER